MRHILPALALVMLLVQPAAAQIPGQNPDWPCAQRLVETLGAGAYWNGPVTADPNWRNDAAVFGLVTDVVDRDTPDTEALAKLTAYAATLPKEGRATKLPALFAAIVDQTNDQRTPLIQRLEQLGRRQRGMGDTIAKLSNTIDATPAADPHHDDLVGERVASIVLLSLAMVSPMPR